MLNIIKFSAVYLLVVATTGAHAEQEATQTVGLLGAGIQGGAGLYGADGAGLYGVPGVGAGIYGLVVNGILTSQQ